MEEEARTIYVQEVTQLHVKNGLPAETLLSKTGKRSCQVSSVFLYPHIAECKTAARPPHSCFRNHASSFFKSSPSKSSYETGTLILSCTDLRFSSALDCSCWYWSASSFWELSGTLTGASSMNPEAAIWEEHSLFCSGARRRGCCLNCFCKGGSR